MIANLFMLRTVPQLHLSLEIDYFDPSGRSGAPKASQKSIQKYSFFLKKMQKNIFSKIASKLSKPSLGAFLEVFRAWLHSHEAIPHP